MLQTVTNFVTHFVTKFNTYRNNFITIFHRVNSINAPSTIGVVSHCPLMFNLLDPFPSYYKNYSTLHSVKNFHV